MSSRLSFDYELRKIRTAALELDYYLVPWDTEILGVPVAQIAAVQVLDQRGAAAAFAPFLDWCHARRIALCAARVPSERMQDCIFLEEHGFRFIELNYQPRLTRLQSLSFLAESIEVSPATASDRVLLTDFAAQVFRHGRFHQDPRLGPRHGDRRYAAWLDNAFDLPHQQVMKCLLDGQIIGFFVVETPSPEHCHWALNGLAPGLEGQGFGKRVWGAMLEWHRRNGISTISTSISSHNVAALNLYVALGFRFPPPAVTLHWCPRELAGTAP